MFGGAHLTVPPTFPFSFCLVVQINATWPEKCLQPGVTRCTLEHNHRLSGPLRAGRQDPVLPEELLAEHVSALKEWARIPVAVRTQVGGWINDRDIGFTVLVLYLKEYNSNNPIGCIRDGRGACRRIDTESTLGRRLKQF